MKLIFAIVNNDDSHSVSSSLTQGGFQATKLASTGGFLMSGNTTFMICSQDDQVDNVIDIISKHSHKRQQFVPNSASYRSWQRRHGQCIANILLVCCVNFYLVTVLQ